MIEFEKPFISLPLYLFDCMLNIVPITLIAVEVASNRREDKIFAFLKTNKFLKRICRNSLLVKMK